MNVVKGLLLERALTVRDLVQGAFDVLIGHGGLRAVSQAIKHARREVK